jgi:hypothetical protein
MRAFLLFLSLVFGQAAFAQTLEEKVRAALVAADPDQLESLIDAAQTEALATGNHEDIRFVYRRIFATTNPAYETVIRDWVATHPDSAYAWTALGDMQFWQALAYRVCNCYSSHGPKPLGDGFVELLPQAQLSALRAHALDPAFVRATLLSLLTFNVGQHGFSPYDVARETLAVAPNYRIVVEVAKAAQGTNRGDFAAAYATCVEYAPYVSGYTSDQCAVEVALTTNTDWELQQAARAAVNTDPSPLFDALRAEAAQYAETQTIDLPEVIAIHNAQVTEAASLATWLDQARWLGAHFDNQFYGDEARALAVAEARKRLLDDPRNPWLALMLIDQAPYDPDLPARVAPPEVSVDRVNAMHAQTSALWRAVLPFGYQSGYFWLAGVQADVELYLGKPVGTIAAIPYVENALILTGHNEYTVINLFQTYVWATYDAWSVDRATGTSGWVSENRPEPPEPVRCTIARLARMMEYTCKSPAADSRGLCVNGKHGDEVQDILLKLQEPTYCPAVLAMSPSELAYTELRAVPGLFDPATYAGPATAP